MILKGNIRANGAELARHLLNDRHEIDPEASFQPPRIGNERVEVAELRGFVADDLAGAFAEAEAIAAGTKCTKPLYSLSINPSQPMTRDQYAAAVDRIEQKLGLEDQARALVFHVKNGREHCHVVWSRIDTDKMQARHMEFDHQKLREIARELVREFGHEMPRHLGEDRGADRFKDRFNEQTLAEQGQARRSGLDPADRKKQITEAYQRSDTGEAFRAALGDHGFILAQGDKRGFVVVDREGEVHSLTRQIDGAKAKEIRAKLDGLRPEDLPTVQQAKERHAELAREKATERPQERPEPVITVAGREEALEALKAAQRADMKALKGDYAEHLKTLREQERERIEQAKSAIKDTYRDDWRDLFARQRDEMKAATTLARSPVRRLQWLLGHDNMDKQQEGAKGYLAAAFKFMTRDPKERTASLRRQFFTDEARTDRKAMFAFVAKGELDFKKLERTHERERGELADLQKAAMREEIRAIRQETTERRAEAREQHQEAITATWDGYTDRIKDGYQQLKEARKEARRRPDPSKVRPQPDNLEQVFSPLARLPNRTPEATREADKKSVPVRNDRTDAKAAAKAQLEKSRKLIEEQGRDSTAGQNAERSGRATSREVKAAREERSQFGFGRQGFNRQGVSFGRDQDGRDEKERERELKPPPKPRWPRN